MHTFDDLIKRDSVRAACFWIDSIDAGPYAENEKFDVVFTRETGFVVSGGETQRRTLYAQGIMTAQVDSRRKNAGRAIRPDLTETLAHVIADAHTAAQYDSFAEWASDQRDPSRGYRDAFADFEDWTVHRDRHAHIIAWLGPVGAGSSVYDAYAQAAQAWLSEN